MFECLALAHTSVLIQNTTRSLQFYCDVLGLQLNAARPDLGYPGAWLNVGVQQIHLLELPNPDADNVRPLHAGRDRHIALYVNNIAALAERLTQANIAYTKSRSGRAAIFCRDPDGNGLEFIEQPAAN